MLGSLVRMPPVAKKFQHHQRGAQHDRGIRQIEGVPVMAADMKVNEVGDAVAQNAIENVSRRSAQNQREAALAQPSAGAASGEQPQQQSNHGDEKTDQQRSRARRFSESASNPNATPGLVVCTRFKQPGHQDAQRARPP